MVTVETALGFVALVLVVAALLVALIAAQNQAELCHSVRVGARAHAVGSSASSAALAVSSGPVDVQVEDGGVWFTVSGSAPAIRLGHWETPPLHCSVKSMREPYLSWPYATP